MDDTPTCDENLLVVAAVEGLSRRHDIPAWQVVKMLSGLGVIQLIRDNYPVLHTQSLEESVDFAEDVLDRLQARLVGSEAPELV